MLMSISTLEKSACNFVIVLLKLSYI